MNKKERKAWIKKQPGRIMTAEEFAEVQGMTHAEFQNPTKLKDFYDKIDKDKDEDI